MPKLFMKKNSRNTLQAIAGGIRDFILFPKKI